MQTTVNIHDAKTHLSRLLVKVAKGHEIVIARAGRPVAKLSAVSAHAARKPGAFRGHIPVSKKFFEPLTAEEIRAWEGS